MDKSEAINKVLAFKVLLKDHLAFDKVYLFGSYAKGLQRVDSDIDVAVVVNSVEGDFFSINPLLWKIRRLVDDRIEPILVERDFDDAGFLSEIEKEGIEIV
jgi:uncharacterized protein